MKSKDAKRVNRVVKQLNKSLTSDVFGTRFWLRQNRKSNTQGTTYYLYELCDRLQPERNKLVGWYSEFEIIKFHPLHIEMNDFIVTSDFWVEYSKNK